MGSLRIRAISLLKNDTFQPIFGQEISDSQPEGTISSKFEWKKKGKAYEFTINQAVAGGVNFNGAVFGDLALDEGF